MHPARRLTRHAGLTAVDAVDAAALHMVEDKDAAGAQLLLDEFGRLRVVDGADLVIVPEVPDGAALFDEREAIGVEPDLVRNRPHVMDRQQMRLMHHVGRRVAGAGLVGVIARSLGRRREVVQLGFDIRQTIGVCHAGILLCIAGPRSRTSGSADNR